MNLASSKLDVDKSDIDELEKLPSNLSSLKSKVDKLDIGNLKTPPVDLNKLSDVVKNNVRKKEYYEFIKIVNVFRLLILVI